MWCPPQTSPTPFTPERERRIPVEFFTGLLEPAALTALVQVLLIDVVLAGDNAVVVGLAAAGLPREQRLKVILVGILAATALRIVFASIAVHLLAIIGLLLAGGILLLWVCWKMWREIRADHEAEKAAIADDAEAEETVVFAGKGKEGGKPRKTFGQAVTQIIIADVSMSLDNVLAVAGAAREHPGVLIIGLALSVALMGLAASLIASLLSRFRWISYIGLAIVLYIALKMIYEGSLEVLQHLPAAT